MKLLVLAVFSFLLPTSTLASELAGGNEDLSYLRPAPKNSTKNATYILNNRYPPRVAKFSRNENLAQSYSNEKWLALSNVKKAIYLTTHYKWLLKEHGLDYPAEILTCKAFRESNFITQSKADTSSAVGISQVLKPTANDLFNHRRGRWFKSRVEGFRDIKDGTTYYNKMSGSIVAQMELGLAVFHQKRLYARMKELDLKKLLRRYRGHKNPNINAYYANKIHSCYTCVKKYGFTEDCLQKARN